MSAKQKISIVMTSLFLCLSIMACEKEGTAEKAGKEVDKAFHAAKDKIQEVTK